MNKRWWLEPLIVILVLAAVFLFLDYRRDIVRFLKIRPIGGEVFTPDLRNGVKVYVLDGYTDTWTLPDIYTETPHFEWLVTDETLSGQIQKICSYVRSYKEGSPYDVLYGRNAVLEYYPQVCLAAGNIYYFVHIINWEWYDGKVPANSIYAEMSGQPLLHVFRYETAERPEENTLFEAFHGKDSLNTDDFARGWYSVLPQKQLDNLMELLNSVGAENAREVAFFKYP